MATLLILLVTWTFLTALFCLALARAAARPLPTIEEQPVSTNVVPEIREKGAEQNEPAKPVVARGLSVPVPEAVPVSQTRTEPRPLDVVLG